MSFLSPERKHTSTLAQPQQTPTSAGQSLAPPPFQLKATAAPQEDKEALEEQEIAHPSDFATHESDLASEDSGEDTPESGNALQMMAGPQTGQVDFGAAVTNGGLPAQLQSNMESLSGMSLDDVNVHTNSAKPAQLKAHAYAQGTDIHLGPGQEKHLPHEAWHVVQQKQGRVKPTTAAAPVQAKSQTSVPVNDNAGLEKEADVMGAKAMQMKSSESPTQLKSNSAGGEVVQRVESFKGLEADLTNSAQNFVPNIKKKKKLKRIKLAKKGRKKLKLRKLKQKKINYFRQYTQQQLDLNKKNSPPEDPAAFLVDLTKKSIWKGMKDAGMDKVENVSNLLDNLKKSAELSYNLSVEVLKLKEYQKNTTEEQRGKDFTTILQKTDWLPLVAMAWARNSKPNGKKAIKKGIEIYSDKEQVSQNLKHTYNTTTEKDLSQALELGSLDAVKRFYTYAAKTVATIGLDGLFTVLQGLPIPPQAKLLIKVLKWGHRVSATADFLDSAATLNDDLKHISSVKKTYDSVIDQHVTQNWDSFDTIYGKYEKKLSGLSEQVNKEFEHTTKDENRMHNNMLSQI